MWSELSEITKKRDVSLLSNFWYQLWVSDLEYY